MKKARFSYLKLTAVVAVLAIVSAWSVSASRATGSAARTNTADVNINSELQTLDSFDSDLSKFDRQRTLLRKKNSVTDAEFNVLKRDRDSLQRRFSQVSNSIKAIITKLKAAGRWEKFDEELLASTNDEKLKASLAEFGGARRLFEDGASLLGNSSAAEDVLGSLGDVQKKVANNRSFEWRSQEVEFRLVASAYRPSEPMFARTAGCILATIGYGARLIAHPFKSPGAINHSAYSCKCHDTDCPDSTQ